MNAPPEHRLFMSMATRVTSRGLRPPAGKARPRRAYGAVFPPCLRTSVASMKRPLHVKPFLRALKPRVCVGLGGSRAAFYSRSLSSLLIEF